jgi:fibronectin type 3 domain-containing protein
MMKKGSMMVQRFVGFCSLSAVFLLVAALGGCGYKTLPVAPQALVPRPINDLRYVLSEKGVTLYWSYPTQTVSGEDIEAIDEFVLYRAVVPADSYCDTCPIPFGRAIALPGGTLPGVGGKTASYESTLLRPGNLYFFKVHSKTGWLAESVASNVISFIWQTPPAAPTGLNVTQGDGQITLQWQPVTSHFDNTEITKPVRYQVSRSQGGAAFTPIGSQLTDTEFVDTTVTNSLNYSYRVQALTVYDQGTVGGGFSEVIETSPVDRTPPAVPLHVRAIRTGSGVKIYWDRGTEKDLLGYRVYRRQSGATEPVFIAEVKEPYNIYDDRDLPVSGRIFYSVTSIDKSRPANESEKSREAAVSR